MKYILQFFLLLLPVGFACCAFGADGTFDQPHIIVFGSAETERVPDELRWVLTVKTERATAAEAAQAHVAEVTSVLTLLAELGLNKDEVETTNMQLKENWVYRNNNREQKGFFGFTGINFTTRDFARYVEFWSKLSSLDNVSISGVSFALSNKAEIEGQVKIKALQNGREKAVSLAAALGAGIAGPLLIEEFDDGGYFPPGPVRAMSMESDGGGGQPVSPGKERVAARMKLVFGLKMK